MKPLWVFFTPDVFPFSKSGGISDYVYSFARSLQESGYAVQIYSPYYERLMRPEFSRQRCEIVKDSVPFGGAVESFEVHTTEFEQLTYHFIRHPAFYDRDTVYRVGGRRDFNLTYFSFMGKAGLQDLKRRHLPDASTRIILQGNDVYASLFAGYLDKSELQGHDVTTVYCIHNLGAGYIAERTFYDFYSLDAELKNKFGEVYEGKDSWCELLLPLFDKVITVSDTYAQELRQGPAPIHAHLQERYDKREFKGVLNGIDLSYWSIGGSPHLDGGKEPSAASGKLEQPERSKQSEPPERFDSGKLSSGQSDPVPDEDPSMVKVKARKAYYKKLVCSSHSLEAHRPLFAFIGRICSQKGLDTLHRLLEAHSDLQLIVMGDGEPLEQFIGSGLLERAHAAPYGEAECHRLMAAADYLLVPSRFEPCGLVAMYGARFGALPLVRRTGGLAEIADRIGSEMGTACSFTDDTDAVELVGRILCGEPPSEAVPHAGNLKRFEKPRAETGTQQDVARLAAIAWDWQRSIRELERFIGLAARMEIMERV